MSSPPSHPVSISELRPITTVPEGFSLARTCDEVMDAQEIVAGFGADHGWGEPASRRVFDKVVIFADQQGLWSYILNLHGMDPKTPLLTKGLAAGCEQRVLMAITPDEYQRVQPEYASANSDSWARLIAHELVHRLHVELLEGGENRMGPTWFFEGFAVFGSGQSFVPSTPPEDPGLLLRWASSAEGPGAYAKFGHAVRTFAKTKGLGALVERAGDEDFETWVVTP